MEIRTTTQAQAAAETDPGSWRKTVQAGVTFYVNDVTGVADEAPAGRPPSHEAAIVACTCTCTYTNPSSLCSWARAPRGFACESTLSSSRPNHTCSCQVWRRRSTPRSTGCAGGGACSAAGPAHRAQVAHRGGRADGHASVREAVSNSGEPRAAQVRDQLA